VEGEGSLSDTSCREEDQPESTQQPVARRQIRHPLASTAQDDQLLLEEEILRYHRSHPARATEPCAQEGQVQQGKQEVPHVRASVGQTWGAEQRSQSWIRRENSQFEMHRVHSRAKPIINGSSRPPGRQRPD